ncbi:hypothetical protein pD_gene0073 [Vibrio phage 033B]|nr:hypothetical protein pD_gene0073 [Vibrio phage 033B]
MAITLLEALGKLDPTNEDHWTADGLPRIDPLSEMVGIAVQRQSVTAVAPEFTRSNPTLPTNVATSSPEPAIKPNEKQDPELAQEGAPEFNEPEQEPDPEPEEVREQVLTQGQAIAEAEAALNAADQNVQKALAARAEARRNLEEVVRKNRKTPAQRRVEQRNSIKRFQRSQAKLRAGRK